MNAFQKSVNAVEASIDVGARTRGRSGNPVAAASRRRSGGVHPRRQNGQTGRHRLQRSTRCRAALYSASGGEPRFYARGPAGAQIEIIG